MAGSTSGPECDNFDWDTEDELEIENFPLSSSSRLPLPNGEARGSPAKAILSAVSSGPKLIDHFVRMGFSEEMVDRAIQENGEDNLDLILEALLRYTETAAAGPSNSKCFDHFVGMGFCETMVAKAIEENGEGNTDSILEALLTYSALEKSPQEQTHFESDYCSSECEENFLDDYSDIDISSEDEETNGPVNSETNKLLFLVKMGFKEGDALVAIERCGPDSTVEELTDFISAAQVARDADALLPPEDTPILRRRQLLDRDILRKKKKARVQNEDDETIRLPKPMIGFGVPNGPAAPLTYRNLPEAAMGPPYFYYENVALAPKGVWTTISRFLYDVEPEFVDSKYFCAAARKRGYVHNLPIQNRFPLLPLPPHTIHEALPLTKKWWPSWDERTKLNCLQTCIGSAKLTERIRKALEQYDGVPPLSVQKFVLDECRKWNLVWVGRNKVAPLEADEVEMLLGFPKNHTRGGGISRTDRYKSLGNSFQVDTVAYHLSVLKDMFPEGINLLSLFSGIGGAEVALHRLGVRLKTVVSVEISEVNRNIQRSWWEQTGQKGRLIDIEDVQQLNADRLEEIMSNCGAFDLVVGGSPCNNLAGSNRHSRDGLEGKESSLFYDYFRILDLVKCMITNRQ
ncbi:DNA (cytosine-5)-methyltransferase DRM1-like [Tripterygium wilfordii]|uniref:DNA (cytosine-5-)-methyltransferase n=1 Tax=Tripterygium wilfordii TaxID=458696 RepID=A0A7J7DKN1_TRIWF|nr:DNA (cytosine-5)-methyltransferase DRM1-like [Tripterygium wilfordii]XP_038704014.1 DNA (cytosine-5)-methyltransferase DRM1-like [Tripterygium wilfordii]XP_038704015.1 DNA (cytosine-5)-methyltransferase DRM1-like [Tripterygium wilfordii]XP_038704016.1 DNA (cytosine-5)-methyltransferase DRM1-like [Tripterygium wilfordii]XP_038704017.1 DNA (cytosine-5)-methyltransferase DRM1-like [Tripterygium wilfordii]KAF5746873.1 DNA (cytosine-5)-methyltransferase DRM1-like [Tripterygium wilfordii]